MSVVDSNIVQVGNSATALNNLVITTDGAGNATIEQGVIGGGGNRVVMTISSTGQIEYPARVESMVRLNTANGYGSTNTKIRRFTNVVTNTGSDITYADSATLGASFTINTDGVYAISYSDSFDTGENLAISLNSAQLTTSAGSILTETRLALATTGSALLAATVATCLYLPAGSIIRAHGSNPAGIADRAQFTITRVA